MLNTTLKSKISLPYKLLLTAFAGLFLSLNISNVFANNDLQLSNSHDVCYGVAGEWEGVGLLDVHGLFTCKYHTSAKVYYNDDVPVAAAVKIKKISLNPLCPKHHADFVDVYCNNNRIQLKNTKIDVAGPLSADGQFADLKGNVFSNIIGVAPFRLILNKVEQ